MKKIFDIPPFLWLVLLAGDVVVGYLGHQGFVNFGFSKPLLIEISTLLGLNILLLVIRAFFPKIWKSLTTEDVNDK